MLALSGVLLVGAAYFLMSFAYHVCRHRPASFWASEACVLAFLAPAVMVLLAAASVCFAKFWMNDGLRNAGGVEATLAVVLLVMFLLLGSIAGKKTKPA